MINFIKEALGPDNKSKYFLASLFKTLAVFFEFITIYSIIPLIVRKGQAEFYFLPKALRAYAENKFPDGVSTTQTITLFLILGVFYSFFRLIGNRMVSVVYRDVTTYIRHNVLKNINLYNFRSSKKVESSMLNHFITIDSERIANGVVKSIEFFPVGLMILFTLFFTLKFSLMITLVTLGFFIVNIMVFTFFNKKVKSDTKKYLANSVSLNKMSENLFFKLKFFKLNNYLKFFSRKIEIKSKNVSEDFFQVERSRDIISFLFETLGIVYIFIFFIIVLKQGKDLGNAVFILVIFYRISPGLILLQSRAVTMRVGAQALNNINDCVNYLKAEETSINHDLYEFDLHLKKGELSTDSLNHQLIVQQDIDIVHGEKVLIKGASGAGKSTLIDRIVGYLENNNLIFIGHINVHNFSDDTIAKCFSWSFDEVPLFDGSIKENIVFGKTINEKKLNLVVEISGLQKILKKNAKNLDFEINSNSPELSSGEQQRISIARAIYLDRPVMIFDEVMNNLDRDSEEKIIKAIIENFPEKTFIYLSHRTELDKYFDKIIKIENNSIFIG